MSRRDRANTCATARRCARPRRSAARHSLSRWRMDGTPSGASRPRQPHELIRALQACAHRARTDHSSLHGEFVGGVAGGKIGANRVIARAPGLAAQALDACAAWNQAGGVEEESAASGDGLDEPRKGTRALRMARTPSRRARYVVEGTNELVGKQSSVLRSHLLNRS